MLFDVSYIQQYVFWGSSQVIESLFTTVAAQSLQYLGGNSVKNPYKIGLFPQKSPVGFFHKRPVWNGALFAKEPSSQVIESLFTTVAAQSLQYVCTCFPPERKEKKILSLSNEFSRESPWFQTSFRGSQREPRSLIWLYRKTVDSGVPNILILISSASGVSPMQMMRVSRMQIMHVSHVQKMYMSHMTCVYINSHTSSLFKIRTCYPHTKQAHNRSNTP